MALVKVPYWSKYTYTFHLFEKQLSSGMYHQGRDEVSELQAGNIDVLSSYLIFFSFKMFCFAQIEIFCSRLKCGRDNL